MCVRDDQTTLYPKRPMAVSSSFKLSDFSTGRTLLGTGAQASTYLTTLKSDGSPRCLKQIYPNGRSHRRYKEAQILTKLEHKNLIRCYGSFTEDDVLYLVLEYAPYQSLRNLIDV